ncbi:MAG: fibronectin type III domain-containing protein [Verrucomicrobiota bacterium]
MIQILNRFRFVTVTAAALIVFFHCSKAFAATPKQYAVEASATVQASPAQIRLTWPADGNATGYTVSRKAPSASAWSTLGSLPGNATGYTDSSVTAGTAYEYQISKTTSPGYRGYGYVYAGINVPLVEGRGKVVLVVDNTHAAALANELSQLVQNLVGDGWTVIRRDVSRTDSVASVKALIKAEYNADPANVKSVFLFGHVPVPYSGNFNPDGHPDHQGAWPADAYYGDMDGNWTDSSVNTSSAARPANRNVPGDGKFDQTDLPSNVELQVGRVDLFNMTCYANKTPSRSELDLLRQYLNKDHNWRHKLLNVPRRGLVCDNFGERDGEAFAASGWRNFAPMFGAANVTSVPGWTYFTTLSSQGYVWSYGCGGGSYYTCDGIGSSDNFATTDIQSVFTMFLGSYFGDWDNESNFLRAPLGTTTYGLTASWAGRPHNFYHSMALGETIGHGIRLSQNNTYGGTYSAQNWGTRQVHVALLGDPTLRLHPVAPPSSLVGSAVAGNVVLNWSPAVESDLQGYHVYRSSSPLGPFARVSGSAPLTTTTFTDAVASGTYTYMVRTIKLEQSASGSYFNASQGVFVTVNTSGNGGGTLVPPANLTATAASSSQINLNWSPGSGSETGFKIERKTSASGAYAQIGNVAAGVRSYSDSGLSAGTQYFYRVRASYAQGDSSYSNESSATTSSSGGGNSGGNGAAVFVSTDTATQGNWKGKYGAEGYSVIGRPANYPAYAQASLNSGFEYQWSDSTSDVRALQQPTGSSRIAACWFSPLNFTVPLNLSDGKTHRVALYFLDWDTTTRVQTVEVLDTASGAVLNSQTVSSFAGGKYLIWDLKGNVTFRFTRQAGNNAVVMGLFFDAAPAEIGGGGGSTTPVTAKVVGLTNTGLKLRLTGPAGQQVRVESSSDLKTWQAVETVTLNASEMDWVDATAIGAGSRFYRAVPMP